MDRNKRPALTSPWKIGFLVSLFLVTVSIGVGFAITRTFGIAWSWIQFGEGSWTLDSWVFDKNAFVHEMLPLVVLVPVLSLLSYLLITGAVRRYKSYLDSGLDYKHLVQSIKRIDDLGDQSIKTLRDYPELRDFLLRIKNEIGEREKVLQEKEQALDSQNQKISSVDQIKAEAGVLVGAISRGPVDGFSGELALSLPELKQVEDAIRQHLLDAQDGTTSMSVSDFGEQMAHLRLELVESAEALKQMLSEILAETVASQDGAREIELLLSEVKGTTGQGAPGPNAGTGGDGAETTPLIERLDQTSQALVALGDATKSVAINTALKAGGGECEVSELVKLADDVRDLAAEFNGIAAQYQEVGQQLRSAVQSLPEGGGSEQIDEMIETTSGKVTLWIERSMILGEKLNAFEQHFSETHIAFEAKLGGVREDEAYQAVDDLASDDGSGGIDGAKKVKQADEFERQQTEEQALKTEVSQPASVAGLEQNRDLFEEIGGKTEDNLFADIPPESGPEEPIGQVQTAADQSVQPDEDDTRQAPPPVSTDEDSSTELFEDMASSGAPDESGIPPESGSRSEPGEFLQSQVDLSGVDVEGTTVPEVNETATGTPQAPAPPDLGPPAEVDSPRSETTVPSQPPHGEQDEFSPEPASADSPAVAETDKTAAAPEDEPVYDLYELGAVDYEPSIHQNA